MGETLTKCIICLPRIRSTEGADHTGRDFFLQCGRCGTRTINHVEANSPGEAEAVLRKEWKSGRIHVSPGRAALASHQSGEAT